jgi:hypothetical protein
MSINSLRINQAKFKKNLRRSKRILRNKIPKAALKRFKKETPRAILGGGNARSKTVLKKKNLGFEIIGDYPYSGVIDEGKYPNPPKKGTGKTLNGYSTQAMRGLVDPTRTYIERLLRRYFRRFK